MIDEFFRNSWGGLGCNQVTVRERKQQPLEGQFDEVRSDIWKEMGAYHNVMQHAYWDLDNMEYLVKAVRDEDMYVLRSSPQEALKMLQLLKSVEDRRSSMEKLRRSFDLKGNLGTLGFSSGRRRFGLLRRMVRRGQYTHLEKKDKLERKQEAEPLFNTQDDW